MMGIVLCRFRHHELSRRAAEVEPGHLRDVEAMRGRGP